MSTPAGHLVPPEPDEDVRALYDADVAEVGHVMNLSRIWAHQPAAHDALFALLGQIASAGGLDPRLRAVLVSACASTLGDAYCSLAWGSRLAGVSDAVTAAAVLRGDDSGLTDAEHAAATWTRAVVRDPNGTTYADVEALRDNGFDDGQIFAMTAFVALRLAFSTVNDALGAQPDAAFRDSAPAEVLEAVDYGRPLPG